MFQMHLVMPMGGHGQRFFDNGFVIPKPLIEIKNKPFFYWSAMSIIKYMPQCDITFVVLQEHVDKFNIKEKILNFFPEANIIVIDHVLAGAVLTCMAGIEMLQDDIPVIFNDCDHLFRCNSLTHLSEADRKRYDGLLLTFSSNSPKYSYVKCNLDGIVEQTVEKQVISHDAICGAYYFRNSSIFKKNAELYLKKCNYNEFFISGVYNCMAENGLCSGILRTDFHVSFGTPEEYAEAEGRSEFEEFV